MCALCERDISILRCDDPGWIEGFGILWQSNKSAFANCEKREKETNGYEIVFGRRVQFRVIETTSSAAQSARLFPVKVEVSQLMQYKL